MIISLRTVVQLTGQTVEWLVEQFRIIKIKSLLKVVNSFSTFPYQIWFLVSQSKSTGSISSFVTSLLTVFLFPFNI